MEERGLIVGHDTNTVRNCCISTPVNDLNERGRTSEVLKGADACGVWCGQGSFMYVSCLNVDSRYICSSKPFVYLGLFASTQLCIRDVKTDAPPSRRIVPQP